VDGWRPEWRVWLEFDVGRAAAQHLDALRSTHPIHAEVKNPEDMGESFDLITYEKGGAVLRMIEAYLGEPLFREGIRLYMRRHARANARAADLWSALGEASGQPVSELAASWIGTAGFPIVRLERRGGATLRCSQRRFLSEAGAEEPGRVWPVPMVIRWRDAAGVREHRVLLRAAEQEVALPAQGEVAWVHGNAGAAGFYRVDHAVAGVADLARHLGDLEPAERVALLADEWALVRRADRPIAPFLDLLAAFGGETDYAVLDELAARLAAVEQRLQQEGTRARFQAFVRGLLGPGLAAAGWDPRPGDGDAGRLRRATLVRAVGLTGRDPEVAAEAQARLGRFFAGGSAVLEANLHGVAVALAARHGGQDRYDQFSERRRGEPDPTFRRRYLLALAQFEDAAQARRALDLAFGGEVPLQEMGAFLGALLGNRSVREEAWRLLRERWGEVSGRIGTAAMLLRHVVEAVGLLPGRRHLEEAERFFAENPIPAARQAVAQTLERMRQDVALWERCAPEVERWLANR
jgi:puromycin-sensitive aminopeptidase